MNVQRPTRESLVVSPTLYQSAQTHVASDAVSPQATCYLAGTIDIAPGLRRHCHRWLPSVPHEHVRHACVLVHGLGDHGGRYHRLGRELAGRGVPLQVVDLIGHGRSPGRRGRIESYEALLGEVDASLLQAATLWPAASLTLIGQSMGGNLAASAAVAWYGKSEQEIESEQCARDILPMRRSPHAPLADRLVLISPMLRPPGQPLREDFVQAGVKLAKLLPNWPLRTTGQPERLMIDPAAQEAHRRDQLIHHTMSVRLGIELLLAGRRLLKHYGAVPLSTLVLYGTDDVLIDLESLHEFALQSDSIRCEAIPGARHEPLQEDWCDHILDALSPSIISGHTSGIKAQRLGIWQQSAA